MAGGLVGLLDDVAALAKLAAASIDDVGLAAGRASVKAAGVVVDDTAVTPAYVHGLAADRELPIIKTIAKGSLRNKLLFILPAALILSAIAPILVEIILMAGGTYLCFEGIEKLYHKLKNDDHDHDVPAVDARARRRRSNDCRRDPHRPDPLGRNHGHRAEGRARRGLRATSHHPRDRRAAHHHRVYGVVALIVKMDDVGLSLAGRSSRSSQRIGRALVTGMPKLLAALSAIGTAAMLWVGGHILLVGADELGWHGPYDSCTTSRTRSHDVGGIGGVLPGWSTPRCRRLSGSSSEPSRSPCFHVCRRSPPWRPISGSTRKSGAPLPGRHLSHLRT